MQNVMLASLNDALNTIGIRVTSPSGNVGAGDWSISDGKSLQRYQDGVVSVGAKRMLQFVQLTGSDVHGWPFSALLS
jgi:hypothetical protein